MALIITANLLRYVALIITLEMPQLTLFLTLTLIITLEMPHLTLTLTLTLIITLEDAAANPNPNPNKQPSGCRT